MFFKRSQPGEVSTCRAQAVERPRWLLEPVTATVATATGDCRGGQAQPLPASELRRVVNPASLGFKTTDELIPINGLIGQERALKAIQFGTDIKSHDFNMFVLGPPASGKTTAVKAHLGPKAADAPTPPDWAYVYNFENPNRPKALKLPSRRAKDLAKGMIAALDELRGVLPARFESEDYQTRRRAIDEQFRSGNEEALEALSKKAQRAEHRAAAHPHRLRHGAHARGQGGEARGVQRPARGHAAGRGEQDRRAGEGAGGHPGAPAQGGEEAAPAAERAQRGGGHLGDPRRAAGAARLLQRRAGGRRLLEAAGHDMVRNVGLFLATGEEENAIVRRPTDSAQDPRFRRYLVNVMAANGERHRRGPRHRGEQPHLRQHRRARRAPRPDGHARHRLPADQARRPAQGQRRIPAGRCPPAAALAVRLGGPEAGHQGARDPHRAADRGVRAWSPPRRSTPSRSRSTSRWCCSATASSTTCSRPTTRISPAFSRCRRISTTPSPAPRRTTTPTPA